MTRAAKWLSAAGGIICLLGLGFLGSQALDRLLYYHGELGRLEELHPQEGLRLSRPEDVAKGRLKKLCACVGGSIFYYWFLPEGGNLHFANWGGLEEKARTTWERFPQTVLASGADYVLINAGFCEIHTAIHTGRPVEPVIENNVHLVQMMVESARENGVVPVVSTLSPVRPRFLFAHWKWGSLPSEKKERENQAIASYNERLREYCARQRIHLIDLHRALSDKKGYLRKDLAVLDGEHLTQRGYRFLDDVLVREMEKIVASDGGRSSARGVFPAGS